MVIKSPFKDYYDYVANQYGGGDPRIVYTRTRLAVHDPSRYQHSFFVDTEALPLTDPTRFHMWEKINRRMAYLVIAGKPYLLSRPASDLNDNANGYRVEPLVDPEEDARPSWKKWRPKNVEFGKEYPRLVEFSREIGHPVFIILGISHGWQSKPTKVEIANQCPILKNLGIASMIPPQQMYQDLSYFVGNLMKESPDVKPPIELSNKQKIIKAGFDLVKSFRHRT